MAILTNVYSASGTFTPAATPTDIVIIEGSATKKIQVLSFIIATTNTAAGSQQFNLIKRSSADTTGTFSAATKVPLDSFSVASTVNRIGHFTVNPGALGSAVGTIAVKRVASPAAVPASFDGVVVDASVDMLKGIEQPVVLRGIAQTLALNFGGVALVSGQTHAYCITWVER